MSKEEGKEEHTPMTLKRNMEREKAISEMVSQVQKLIKQKLGKDVKVPDDLKSGVIICQLLKKILPDSIDKFDENPKNNFAAAQNFELVCFKYLFNLFVFISF